MTIPTPTPADKFSFGLWTIGWQARDPFGDATRPPIDTVEAVERLSDMGAYGITFHDDDLIPFGSDDTTREQHIKAFRDTMQITTPMTDAQWENMLKPKILEEREAAELQEHQRAQQLAALQAAMPSAMPEDAFTRPAKEVYDREYELSQDPLRQKLGEYATDHINGRWHQGRSLDKDSAPLFAVDVLLHVHQRYTSDRDAGNLSAVIDAAPKFQGSKQGTPPLEPSLSLDNMKWVFDNKVRSYTDPLRRELFICAGCAEDRKPKWFAFEGLIQHFGAKHTSAFSKGNVVVHW